MAWQGLAAGGCARVEQWTNSLCFLMYMSRRGKICRSFVFCRAIYPFRAPCRVRLQVPMKICFCFLTVSLTPSGMLANSCHQPLLSWSVSPPTQVSPCVDPLVCAVAVGCDLLYFVFRVCQNSSVRTGLPFHVDGPFFVSRRGGKASLVMDSPDNNRGGL